MQSKLANDINKKQWKPNTCQEPSITTLATSIFQDVQTESYLNPPLKPISIHPCLTFPFKSNNTMQPDSWKNSMKKNWEALSLNLIIKESKFKISEDNLQTEWIKLLHWKAKVSKIKRESKCTKDRSLTSKANYKKCNMSSKTKFNSS